MKVLHVGKYAPPYAGGVERYIEWLMPALRAHQTRSLCLAHAHPGRPSGLHRCMSVPIVAAPVQVQWLYTPISLAFAVRLDYLIKRWQPDLLHLHVPNPACFWALLLPSARRVPWLLQWHSDVPDDAKDWRVRVAYRAYRPWEQALLKHSRLIVATSPPYAASSAPLQAHSERVRVVPLGIPEQPPEASPDRALWPAAGTKVLSVGRLTYYKGHEVLIEALAHCPDMQLLIVGEGERRPLLQQRINALGLSARVHLVGNMDSARLAALYQQCDLFCLPSVERSEAFGLVLVEAMRAGKPVLTTNIPGSGVPWVIQNQASGSVVAPDDPMALAAELQRMGSDAALRQRLADAGRQRFLEHFTINASARAIHSLYGELLTR